METSPNGGGATSDQLLRRAFLEIRAGEVEGTRELLDAALADFCAAASARPGWWLPWFGVGVTQRLLAKGRFTTRPADCHTEGTSYTQDAGLSLARALEADSSSTESA